MSLSKLNWRQISTYSATSASISGLLDHLYNVFTGSTYFDSSSRVTGSDTAWTWYKEISGSTTEAIYGVPPTSSKSHAVIIAGSSRAALTPKFNVNDTTYVANRMYIGLAKNVSNVTSSYLTWTNATSPFSGSDFSGYWTMWPGTVPIQTIRAYECEDGVGMIMSSGTANNYGGFAGAIFDPESSASNDSETDGKLYGVVNTGTPVMLLNNVNVATSIFSHNASANSYHCGIFVPGTNTFTILNRNNILQFSDGTTLVTRSGKFVRLPIFLYSTSETCFGARLREIWMVRDSIHGNTFVSSSQTLGYIIGLNTGATSDCVMLTSGSA